MFSNRTRAIGRRVASVALLVLGAPACAPDYLAYSGAPRDQAAVAILHGTAASGRDHIVRVDDRVLPVVHGAVHVLPGHRRIWVLDTVPHVDASGLLSRFAVSFVAPVPDLGKVYLCVVIEAEVESGRNYDVRSPVLVEREEGRAVGEVIGIIAASQPGSPDACG